MITEHALTESVSTLHAHSPETRLNHAAWVWQDLSAPEQTTLRTYLVRPNAPLWLHLRAANEELFLGISESACLTAFYEQFPTPRDLPPDLLMVALDPYLTPFFAVLSRAVGEEITLLNACEAPPEEATTAWCGAWCDTAETPLLTFLLALPMTLREKLSANGTLQGSHPTLAQTPLHAEVIVTAFVLTHEERTELAQGDALLLPEWGMETENATAVTLVINNRFARNGTLSESGELTVWGALMPYAPPKAPFVRVIVGDPLTLTLAQCAAWCSETPPNATFSLSAPSALKLRFEERCCAWGHHSCIGSHPIFSIDATER